MIFVMLFLGCCVWLGGMYLALGMVGLVWALCLTGLTVPISVLLMKGSTDRITQAEWQRRYGNTFNEDDL